MAFYFHNITKKIEKKKNSYRDIFTIVVERGMNGLKMSVKFYVCDIDINIKLINKEQKRVTWYYFLWKRTFEMFDSRSLGSIKSLEHRRNANTYVRCKKDNNDKIVWYIQLQLVLS